MPYRRLPNTDQARLHALQNAIQRAQTADFTEQVIPYKVLSEAQRFLVSFENVVMQSKDNYTSTVNANKQYRHIVQNARMYISHFIQVLNLSVIRGEIKKEQKLLYGLDPHQHVVPDLSTEEYLLEWGKKIIEGNTERVHGDLEPLREQADAIILNIWNLVEDFYKDQLPYAKLMKCQLYGVIYYYRKGERKLTAESDREIQRIRDSQPTIQWSVEE